MSIHGVAPRLGSQALPTNTATLALGTADARFAHEIGDPVVASYGVTVLRQVVQRGERVRLAATELGDEREHRRRVVGSPGEPA
jgi:hypothetical protein